MLLEIMQLKLKGPQSIGLMWWMLAREVLLIKGKMTRQTGFVLDDKEIMPDLYFYRDPDEQEKEEAVEAREIKEPWGAAAAAEPGKLEEVRLLFAVCKMISGMTMPAWAEIVVGGMVAEMSFSIGV